MNGSPRAMVRHTRQVYSLRKVVDIDSTACCVRKVVRCRIRIPHTPPCGSYIFGTISIAQVSARLFAFELLNAALKQTLRWYVRT